MRLARRYGQILRIDADTPGKPKKRKAGRLEAGEGVAGQVALDSSSFHVPTQGLSAANFVMTCMSIAIGRGKELFEYLSFGAHRCSLRARPDQPRAQWANPDISVAAFPRAVKEEGHSKPRAVDS